MAVLLALTAYRKQRSAAGWADLASNQFEEELKLTNEIRLQTNSDIDGSFDDTDARTGEAGRFK
jgi:hypothetical protein